MGLQMQDATAGQENTPRVERADELWRALPGSHDHGSQRTCADTAAGPGMAPPCLTGQDRITGREIGMGPASRTGSTFRSPGHW